MFILHEAGAGQGQIAPRQLMDVAPTVLQRLGVPRPVGMGGEVFP
jgi:bisphosphoglycerate-independent phosphoglycerate mutase (AlkP superfamily)